MEQSFADTALWKETEQVAAKKNLLVSVFAAIGLLIVPALLLAMAQAQQTPKPMAIYAPDSILRSAERSGLWSSDSYPMNFEINPFYLRGDFNGDGENDLAFWVTESSSGNHGIAIIHSTLDALHIFGAGTTFGGSTDIRVDTWTVLAKGTRITLRRDYPDLGLREGQELVFAQEAVSPVWVGKASYAIYWSGGRYHYVGVAD